VIPNETADAIDVAGNMDELSIIFARTTDERHVATYFPALLTPQEIAAVAARWALVKALREKKPQREIAKKFGLSLCKITRGSRELKKADSAFLKMLTILESNKQNAH
jgi:TrpR family trp operon transcriptional repressor